MSVPKVVVRNQKSLYIDKQKSSSPFPVCNSRRCSSWCEFRNWRAEKGVNKILRVNFDHQQDNFRPVLCFSLFFFTIAFPASCFLGQMKDLKFPMAKVFIGADK